jgi:hypothetical protein
MLKRQNQDLCLKTYRRFVRLPVFQSDKSLDSASYQEDSCCWGRYSTTDPDFYFHVNYWRV